MESAQILRTVEKIREDWLTLWPPDSSSTKINIIYKIIKSDNFFKIIQLYIIMVKIILLSYVGLPYYFCEGTSFLTYSVALYKK